MVSHHTLILMLFTIAKGDQRFKGIHQDCEKRIKEPAKR